MSLYIFGHEAFVYGRSRCRSSVVLCGHSRTWAEAVFWVTFGRPLVRFSDIVMLFLFVHFLCFYYFCQIRYLGCSGKHIATETTWWILAGEENRNWQSGINYCYCPLVLCDLLYHITFWSKLWNLVISYWTCANWLKKSGMVLSNKILDLKFDAK